MAREWFCGKCGKPADYKEGMVPYCDKHWKEDVLNRATYARTISRSAEDAGQFPEQY